MLPRRLWLLLESSPWPNPESERASTRTTTPTTSPRPPWWPRRPRAYMSSLLLKASPRKCDRVRQSPPVNTQVPSLCVCLLWALREGGGWPCRVCGLGLIIILNFISYLRSAQPSYLWGQWFSVLSAPEITLCCFASQFPLLRNAPQMHLKLRKGSPVTSQTGYSKFTDSHGDQLAGTVESAVPEVREGPGPRWGPPSS